MNGRGFEPNLVITGFMGAGKTAVGRMVASRLDRRFVDMDAAIEARAGASVETIFQRRGQARFRALESMLCAELAQRRGLVVATGGGTFLSPRNRAAFADAFVVCLDVGPDQVVERLRDTRDRPLLGLPVTRARIAELLAARRDAYMLIPVHVDTRCRSIEEVADQVIDLFRARVHERSGEER